LERKPLNHSDTHIAIIELNTLNGQDRRWMEKVSDEQYQAT